MGQTQNQFDKIRNEHANEILEFEGAFDSDEVAMTLATSIIPSSELVKPHTTREYMEAMARKRAVGLEVMTSTFSDPGYAADLGEEHCRAKLLST